MKMLYKILKVFQFLFIFTDGDHYEMYVVASYGQRLNINPVPESPQDEQSVEH